jgi:type VI protein secretion system component VasK
VAKRSSAARQGRDLPKHRLWGMTVTATFWDIVWLIVWSVLLLSYLMVLFQIVIDLFRDQELGGVGKALWMIFLIVLPVLTALAYVIVRGRGMAIRQNAQAKASKDEADNYIRSVAGKTSGSDIAEAKALLDSGIITQDEFGRLKAKALG